MKLQSLLFPQTGICTEEKMYFRRHGTIDFTWDKDYLNMFRDSSITFDTYFNGCSAEKWFKYKDQKDPHLPSCQGAVPHYPDEKRKKS